MDIVEFLTARLDDDQAAADSADTADPSPWTAATSNDCGTNERARHGNGIVTAADGTALWDCEGSFTLCMTAPSAEHVARHDPARVLREVAAKRAIVEAYQHAAWNHAEARDAAARDLRSAPAGFVGRAANRYGAAMRYADALELAVLRLAAVYADHADFDEAWRLEAA